MNKFNIAVLCWLAPLTGLKFGDVQPVEVYLFIVAPFFIVHMTRPGQVKAPSAEFGGLLKNYLLLLFAMLTLSIVAMRLPVFPPFELPLIKTPPFLSVARIIQLFLGIGTMVFLTMSFLRKPSLIRYFTRTYIYSGLATAYYAVISWIALTFFKVDLGGAYRAYEENAPRAKAFFVEGGPLGTFLVSVTLVVLFRYFVLREGSKWSMWVQLGILLIAEFAAASKAGLLLCIVLLSVFQFANRKFMRMALAIVIVLPLILMSGALDGVGGYVNAISNFSDQIDQHADDAGFMMGRIMGAILLPRMIAAHPLAGIGIGNYSLQRNNPDYLQGLPTAVDWDLPGLGLLGYIAELGIPLMLFLMWLLWTPVRLAGRRQVSALVVAMASYQFFANCLGVQITFIYPWLVTAVGFGYALNQPLKRMSSVERTRMSTMGLTLARRT